jgi:hypothetical protein
VDLGVSDALVRWWALQLPAGAVMHASASNGGRHENQTPPFLPSPRSPVPYSTLVDGFHVNVPAKLIFLVG